jgi:cation transport ATPase
MIEHWYDWWRLTLALISVTALVILAGKRLKHRNDWSEWSQDRWYAMSMWFLAAIVMNIESLVRGTKLGVRLVFVTAAVLVTFRLITKKYDRKECKCEGEGHTAI